MKTKIKFMAAAALLISLVLLCQSAGKVLRKEIQEGRAVSSETGSAVVLLDPGHGGRRFMAERRSASFTGSTVFRKIWIFL